MNRRNQGQTRKNILNFKKPGPGSEDDRTRLKALLDTSPSGIVIIERNHGKVSFFNDKAFRIFGPDLYNIPFNDRAHKLGLRHPDGTPYLALETPASRSLLNGEIVTGEEMIVSREDGSESYISVNTSPLFDRNGEVEAVISVFNDITSKKEAEEKINYQALLLNNVLDAVFTEDTEYNITFWNKGAEIVYGWKASEVCGKNAVGILKTSFSGMSRDHVFQVISRSGEFESDIIQKHKDGQDIHLHSRFRAIKDKSGKIIEYLIINRDITDRKKIETELKESEEAYSLIFNNSPVATVVVDTPSLSIVRSNHAFRDLFGFTDEEINRNDIRKLGIRSAEELNIILNTLKEKGKVRNYETTRKNKDGSNLSLLINLDNIEMKGKTFIMATIVDLTEQKYIQRTLKEKEAENESLARIIELSRQPIAFSDLNGVILYANKAMSDLTGYSIDELTKIEWNKDLTAPEFWEKETCIRNNILETGTPVRFDKEYIRKDGRRVPIEILLNMMYDSKSRPRFWFAFITDISERKKYEENLHMLIRTLKAMQKSSLLIANVGDEKEFLNEVCRIIVEDCGHSLVWIGYKMNDSHKTVLPVASAGEDTSYIDKLKITWADKPHGHGPVGTAVRKGETVICRDTATDPNFRPWKAEAQKRGFASAVAIPLFVNNEIYGVITIYSMLYDSFSEDEILLLKKLADDLSYGINTIRLHRSLKDAKDDLEIKVEERTGQLKKTLSDLDSERQRIVNILNILPSYVVLVSNDLEVTFSNSVFREHFGELSGKELFTSRTGHCSGCDLSKVFENGIPMHWEWYAPNNKYYEVSDFPFTDSDGNRLILEMGIDVTEKKNFDKILLKKILETEEKDRRVFASDLHDDLGPTLSAIKMQLSIIAKEVTDKSQQDLLRICDILLTEGIEKMRNVANAIMPNLIESFGLVSAIKSFINRIIKSSKMKVNFISKIENLRFNVETELHLYRIITELIANTIKHSGATEINILMEIHDEQFVLKYFDNGIGYDFNKEITKSLGLGLQNIRNRVRLIEALLESTIENGKRVLIITRKI